MFLNSNIPAGSVSGCRWYPWWGLVCGSTPLTYGTSAATGIVGGGVRFEPNEDFSLRAGYEYGWTNEDVLKSANVVRFEIGFLM